MSWAGMQLNVTKEGVGILALRRILKILTPFFPRGGKVHFNEQ